MARRTLSPERRSLPVSQRIGRLIGFQVGPTAAPATAADPNATGGTGGAGAKASDLWAYYDAVGEPWFTANFLGACFSRIILRPGWMGDDDKPGPLFDEEGNLAEGVDIPDDLAQLAARLIRALRTVPGGQSSLLRGIGQNLGMAGDLYLLGVEEERDGRGVGRWFEPLSTDELRPKPKSSATDKQRYQRLDKPSGSQGADLPENAFVLRIWQPHPRFRRWSDSPMRPLLTTLEGMRLLTLEQLAQARSRLKGPGVYWIDEDIDIPVDEDQSEEEALTLKMIRVASAAIGDPGSASANVPIIVRAPRDSIRDGIRLDSFDLSSQQTVERRTALVDDFSRGVPLPPEVIKGHQSTTFANAFSIDESTMKIFVASPLELVCGHLTSGYLHPSLLADVGKDLAAEIVERMVVWYDDSNLVTHPDRAKTAAAAVGVERNPNFVISLAASRRYQGFREGDKPDDDEVEERIRRAQLLNARESVQGVVPQGEDAGAGDGSASVPADSPAGTDGAAATNGQAANGQATLALKLAHAADYAADRAIERLGSRLIERVKRDPTLTTDQRNQVLSDKAGLAARLGPETVRRLVGSDLWAGEFAAFEATARRWAKEAHHAKPDLVAARSKTMAEMLATERLFRPGAQVTAAQLAGLVRAG